MNYLDQREAVEAALRDEFEAWIAAHPSAALFDWGVAADNVLSALVKASLTVSKP